MVSKKALGAGFVVTAVVSGLAGAGLWELARPKPTDSKTQVFYPGDDIAVKFDNKDATLHLNEDLSSDITVKINEKVEPKQHLGWSETVKLAQQQKPGSVIMPFALDGNQTITDKDVVSFVAGDYGLGNNNNITSIDTVHYISAGKSVAASTAMGVLTFKDASGNVVDERLFYFNDMARTADLADNLKGDSSIAPAFEAKNARGNAGSLEAVVDATPEKFTKTFKSWQTYVSGLTGQSANNSKGLQGILNGYMSGLNVTEAKRELNQVANYVNTTLGVDVDAEKNRVNGLTAGNYIAESESIVKDLTNKIKSKITSEKSAGKADGMLFVHQAYISQVAADAGVDANLILAKYGTPTAANYSAVEDLAEKVGFMKAWADNVAQDYVSGKKVNLTDYFLNKPMGEFESLDQAIDDYRAAAAIAASLDENDFSGTEKADTLKFLGDYSTAYPWLVVSLDEKNADHKAKLLKMMNEQGSNLSASFKQAISQGDDFYIWDQSAGAGTTMYSKAPTEGIYKLTDNDFKIIKNYLL